MNDEEIILLYAKDRIVKMLGSSLLIFSMKAWTDAVEGVLSQIQDSDIPKIRSIYEN